MRQKTYRVISHPTAQLNHDGSPDMSTATTKSFVRSIDVSSAESLVLNKNPDHTVLSVSLSHPAVMVDDIALMKIINKQYDEDLHDPDDFEGYMYSDFIKNVNMVASALRNENLCPGLKVTFINNTDGVVVYSMVEVRDACEAVACRAQGSKLIDLTEEPGAKGIPGLIAIARALIGFYNSLR